MIITFSLGAGEVFGTLPPKVKEKASRVIELAAVFPEMFPFRKKGVMSGYRCFTVSKYRFFYRASSSEIRISAIVPAVMKRS